MEYDSRGRLSGARPPKPATDRALGWGFLLFLFLLMTAIALVPEDAVIDHFVLAAAVTALWSAGHFCLDKVAASDPRLVIALGYDGLIIAALAWLAADWLVLSWVPALVLGLAVISAMWRRNMRPIEHGEYRGRSGSRANGQAATNIRTFIPGPRASQQSPRAAESPPPCDRDRDCRFANVARGTTDGEFARLPLHLTGGRG